MGGSLKCSITTEESRKVLDSVDISVVQLMLNCLIFEVPTVLFAALKIRKVSV